MSDRDLGSGKTCFVVTPIGSVLAPIGTDERLAYERSIEMWAKVFSPACENFGLRVVRADKIAEPGDLPDQIFTYLRDADIVIADVSGGNPNVMYELGLRHSIHASTIQVGEHGRLPFDVQSIRTIQFERTEMGFIDARNRLVESLRASLEGGPTVLRATSVFTGDSRVGVDPEADSLKSDDPENPSETPTEPGILDVMAEGEEAIYRVADVLGGASETMKSIGTVSTQATEKMADPAVAAKGFAGRLLVSRELARDLEPLSEDLASRAASFRGDVELIDAMLQNVFARAREGDPNEVREFLAQVEGLVDAADGGSTGIMKMHEGVKSLKSLSRDLRPAGETIDRATSDFLSGIRVMLGWRESIDDVRKEVGVSEG